MSGARSNQIVLSQETLNTHFAEAYRALRANIGFSSIDHPVKTILVTSAAPREGKTTTVVNLGIILAQAGSRVLMVDADFRRPSFHHIFGPLGNGNKTLPGLSNLIVGNAGLDGVRLPSGFVRVELVPAGVLPPNPNELLSSKRMQSVMTELADEVDYVLIDSPPCVLYSDAFLLAPLTDGVLYVVRSGSQDRAAQRRVQRQLQQTKARILGVVFNEAAVSQVGGGYGYYYTTGGKR